ncbi:SDR family NAD(P)-dependent oxidoreductase [Pseudoalteromonas carrageenovora]|uniref:SDR family NAD(P)-dependent oxidoreductase n=1 Tax=Pseudoalteromonas carrageenovora TaxID=227 RepID=UPI0026E3FDA1|nr:SDR family NAD(P)-dependent oxidoreductase [Pseudoalteromonas carrageenovora]MDO6548344.1 SDR family NAD(P)-dependent oxidoreductase [Pseudoalteromonas carrageenovora]MDO6832790.1 SDR family NAD(P)-dependent oxidoreductase [Pseudoalteromonas carrageenovora]
MNKTILLTGATDGIGLETAKMLLAQGHTVLLHGRNQDKLNNVQSALNEQYPQASTATYVADLSDMAQVQTLAQSVLSDLQQADKILDVLINNAGVYKLADITTKEGLDARFAVNTIAPYLLTKLLLPAMNAQSRVINVSSAAQSSVNFESLVGNKPLSDSAAYAQSKLAITMWSRHLGLALKATGPLVVSVNPKSLLGSKMVKDAYGLDGGDLKLGADIFCRAALSDEFKEATGLYFDNDAERFAPPHPDALNNAKNQQLVDTLDSVLAQLKLGNA